RGHLSNDIRQVGGGAKIGSGLIFTPHLLDLFGNDSKMTWRADGQLHFAAADVGQLDLDIVANQDRFALAALHHQHTRSRISTGPGPALLADAASIESGC